MKILNQSFTYLYALKTHLLLKVMKSMNNNEPYVLGMSKKKKKSSLEKPTHYFENLILAVYSHFYNKKI